MHCKLARCILILERQLFHDSATYGIDTIEYDACTILQEYSYTYSTVNMAASVLMSVLSFEPTRVHVSQE